MLLLIGVLIITLGCLGNEQIIDKDKTSDITLEGILFKKPVAGPTKFYQSPDSAVSLLYDDNTLYFFDESGKNVRKNEIDGLVYGVSFSENNYILVGTQDKPAIYLFTGRGVLKWEKKLDGNINALSISGNGETIVAGFGYPKTRVRFYDIGEKQMREFVYEKIGSKINSISVSRNGDFVALGSSYQDTNLYFFKDAELLWKFQPVSPGFPGNGINTVKIIGDGSYLFINAVGDCPPHELGCGKGYYLDENGGLI
jgi:WD40 repeat protein